MPRSARDIVRTAVGLAALAPALALIVLAVILMRDGGTSGVLAGLFVAALAIGLSVVALMMTHAPVTIAKLLEQGNDEPGSKPGTNGHPGGEGEHPDAERDR